MYNRLGTIQACDRQTDGQTSCRGIVRATHARRAVIQEAQLSQRGHAMPRVVEYFV